MVFGESLFERSESMDRWSSSGNIPRFTTLDILGEIQKYMKDLQCEPEQTGSSSCQCTTTLYGKNKETEKCEYNSLTVANYGRRFPRGRWSFLGLGPEKKWYGTYTDKPDGDWDRTAERMMLNFAESSHPIFPCHQRPGKGRIKKQRKRKEVYSLQQ